MCECVVSVCMCVYEVCVSVYVWCVSVYVCVCGVCGVCVYVRRTCSESLISSSETQSESRVSPDQNNKVM